MNALRAALLRERAALDSGNEFSYVREYAPGDDWRRIDWAATARSQTTQVRVMQERARLTFACILDRSPSMRVGRARDLASSAGEIAQTWYEAAEEDDRRLRIAEAGRRPSQGGTQRALRTAIAVVPRGAVLLVVGDFFDIPAGDPAFPEAAARFDCTAMIARDPWRDAWPLRGFQRLRDSETGLTTPMFFGKRQRADFAAAVRQRERSICDALRSAGWRTGWFDESSGRRALFAAFGLSETAR